MMWGLEALRCAEGPNCTPGWGFGPRGVQNGRIAHCDGVSGIAVCKKAESHTVTRWNGQDDGVGRTGCRGRSFRMTGWNAWDDGVDRSG
jgi:hypothetical protein